MTILDGERAISPDPKLFNPILFIHISSQKKEMQTASIKKTTSSTRGHRHLFVPVYFIFFLFFQETERSDLSISAFSFLYELTYQAEG